jgi:hypothetical protein
MWSGLRAFVRGNSEVVLECDKVQSEGWMTPDLICMSICNLNWINYACSKYDVPDRQPCIKVSLHHVPLGILKKKYITAMCRRTLTHYFCQLCLLPGFEVRTQSPLHLPSSDPTTVLQELLPNLVKWYDQIDNEVSVRLFQVMHNAEYGILVVLLYLRMWSGFCSRVVRS